MQRLFSTFPEGIPGFGLVILRAAVAVPLIYHAIAGLLNNQPPAALALIAAGAAVLLAIGLWTPVAGAIVAIAELGLALSDPSELSTSLHFALLGAALAMLGPGGWSIDSRLFGRKHIDIPTR